MLFGLMKGFTSLLLSCKVKCLIYKILFIPVLTGDFDTLAMVTQDKNLLKLYVYKPTRRTKFL